MERWNDGKLDRTIGPWTGAASLPWTCLSTIRWINRFVHPFSFSLRRCMVHQSIHREGFSSTHSQRDRFRQSEKRHAFHFRHRIFPKQQHAVWRKSRKQHPHSCTPLQSLIIRIVNTLKGWVSYKLTSTPYLLTLFPTLFPLFIVTHSTFYTS